MTGGTFDAVCTSGTTTPKPKFKSANSGRTDFRLVGADGTTYVVYTLAESGGSAIANDTAASSTGFAADGTTRGQADAAHFLAARHQPAAGDV